MANTTCTSHRGSLSDSCASASEQPVSVSQAVSLPAETHRTSWRAALSSHWPEYIMEGTELGLFMISACAFVVLLEYPVSPIHQAIESSTLRRVLIGLAMGLTAIAIIYSPFGQRSGAHFNPSVTFPFYHLGRVEWWDAVFYSLAQFVG